MRILKTVSELHEWRQTCAAQSLGFVPTMGALHKGHLKLLKCAQNDNDLSLLSIFVNPTQFNNNNDLENYPNTLEADINALQLAGCSALFLPEASEIYSDQYQFKICEEGSSHGLCGATRPGHFEGVMTVVLKLLNLAAASRAYFGEKDYQQLKVIQEMAKAFFHPTQICPVPTVRDEFGLALSSRNQRLSTEGIEKARLFAKTLQAPRATVESTRSELQKHGIEIDYIEERWNRLFAAVFIEDVRLIDNVSLNPNQKQEERV